MLKNADFIAVQHYPVSTDWLIGHFRVYREAEYISSTTVDIFCGTWNVAAKKPDDIDLSEWLLEEGKARANLYVVGFQEIVDLNGTFEYAYAYM